MKKRIKYGLVLISILFFVPKGEAQVVVVRWEELFREWHINSAAYPADEPVLDELYFKLSTMKLVINPDSTYTLFVSKHYTEAGKVQIDRKNKSIVFINKANGKRLEYSVGELTSDYLLLSIGEKYSWAYYLSLTSHF